MLLPRSTILPLAFLVAGAMLAPAGRAQTVLTVTHIADEADFDLLDGVCDADPVMPGNQVTLRAALEHACFFGGAWIIQLGANVYGLSRVGTEDCGRWGDLDVHGCYATVSSIEIRGVPGLTVIDGGSVGERVLHVTSTFPSAATLTLRDLRISGGSTLGMGGGIRHEGGRLELVNVELDGNTAGEGGGLHTVGEVAIDGGFVRGNTATATLGSGKGGGVYAEAGASVVATGTVFESNVAGLGGGLDIQSGAIVQLVGATLFGNQNAGARNLGLLTLDGCAVDSNVNSGSGGGIDNRGMLTAELTGFRSNQAQAGGAINNAANASVTLIECALEQNSATNLGGGLATSSLAELERTTVAENTTNGFAGGGIYAFGSASGGLHLVNSSVGLNQAPSGSGGGLYLAGFAVHEISSSTIAFNQAANGGGVWCDASSQSRSSLYSDNLDTNGLSQNFAGPMPVLTAGFNLDSDGTFLFGDPTDVVGFAALGPLDMNGGPTRTFALLPGSQAIDAGDCTTLAGNVLTEDQRNLPRGAVCDIGSYEAQAAFPSFCDALDGSLAACPCGNAGLPDSGCDNAQSTGGVHAEITGYNPVGPAYTLTASGFPSMSSPTAIVIRGVAKEPAPVVFGDGLRCVGTAGLVRLGATTASGGSSTHTFGHGSGSGTRYLQVWYRNTPSAFCTAAAFNLSNGVEIP